MDSEEMDSEEMDSGFSHKLPGEHVYKGNLFFGFSPPEVLDAVRTFDVRDDDVFVVTYPKAGTTWMQEILWLIMHGADFEEANKKQVYFRSPFLEFKDEVLNEIGLEIASTMQSPRIIKTHLPIDLSPIQIFQKDCKIVVLFRNPKDLCVSYFHFYRSSSSFGNYKGSWSEFLQMFSKGHVDHGSWFNFTRGWWHQKDNPNVLIVFYEDLKKDLNEEIEKICSFLGKNLDSATRQRIANHCSFESMKANPMTNHHDVYSINSKMSPLLRKGMVGDWKNMFTVRQNEEFDIHYTKEMQAEEINFKYEL